MAEIKHPDSDEIAVGRLLKEGETVKKGDLYSGHGRVWIPCHKGCIGCDEARLCSHNFVFVRPEK